MQSNVELYLGPAHNAGRSLDAEATERRRTQSGAAGGWWRNHQARGGHFTIRSLVELHAWERAAPCFLERWYIALKSPGRSEAASQGRSLDPSSHRSSDDTYESEDEHEEHGSHRGAVFGGSKEAVKRVSGKGDRSASNPG